MSTILIILAAIVVVGVCLETTSTKHCRTKARKEQEGAWFFEDPLEIWDDDVWDGCASDGSDGSLPGDPWGTTYDIWGNPDA